MSCLLFLTSDHREPLLRTKNKCIHYKEPLNAVFHGNSPVLNHNLISVVSTAAQLAPVSVSKLWPSGPCGVPGSWGHRLHGPAADASTLRRLPHQERREGEDVEEEMVPVWHGPQATSLLYRLDWLGKLRAHADFARLSLCWHQKGVFTWHTIEAHPKEGIVAGLHRKSPFGSH